METFSPLCFSFLDTNLRILRHHLQALVAPSCNVTLCDRTIAGPGPPQGNSKSGTKWQTIKTCYLAGLGPGGNTGEKPERMCGVVGALAWIASASAVDRVSEGRTRADAQTDTEAVKSPWPSSIHTLLTQRSVTTLSIYPPAP